MIVTSQRFVRTGAVMVVRRLFLTVLCVVGLGVVVFLIVSSRRRDVARAGEPSSRRSVGCEPTRDDVIAGVSRRPLFLMAKKRGVSCGLFVASKWDLFDAILEAEGLSPDRQDSSLSAQVRLRQLAAEAYRREAETERRAMVEQSPKPAQPRAHLPWRRFKSA